MMTRSIIFALAMGCAVIGSTQGSLAVDSDVSEHTLKTLKTLAWQEMPAQINFQDRVLKIDKSDPSKIIVPDEDARRVVRGAYLTARAQRCELPELVQANRDAIIKAEENKKKWSEAQLQYMNTLHLATVQLLVGKIEAKDADAAKSDFDPKSTASPMPKADVRKCTDQEKEELRKAVAVAWDAAYKK